MSSFPLILLFVILSILVCLFNNLRNVIIINWNFERFLYALFKFHFHIRVGITLQNLIFQYFFQIHLHALNCSFGKMNQFLINITSPLILYSVTTICDPSSFSDLSGELLVTCSGLPVFLFFYYSKEHMIILSFFLQSSFPLFLMMLMLCLMMF